MKPPSFTLLFALLLAVAGCNSGSQNSSTPLNSAPIISSGRALREPRSAPVAGTFDYFLLNLSWSPEYCYSHPSAAECAAHDTFVLHGLWPENADDTYPEHCSDAPGPTNPAQYADLYPSPGLLEHEWRQHGTCSGLSPDAYFQAVRSAFHEVRIPAQFSSLSTQISMSPDQILGLFTSANPAIPRSSLVLSCGNNYLTAVDICLDRNLHPTACGALRSCRASTVRIPPP